MRITSRSRALLLAQNSLRLLVTAWLIKDRLIRFLPAAIQCQISKIVSAQAAVFLLILFRPLFDSCEIIPILPGVRGGCRRAAGEQHQPDRQNDDVRFHNMLIILPIVTDEPRRGVAPTLARATSALSFPARCAGEQEILPTGATPSAGG